MIDDWGHEFNLSATQKGELLGVGLWPFSISIVLLSLLIDRVGFRAVLWFAVACHLGGTRHAAHRNGYWSLYIGTFVLALGNGAVEAAVNPLIATAYRHDKTKWLNMLHAGWPGGLVLGGLLALAQGGGVDWRWKIGLVIVPVIVYSLMLLRQRFPVSERVAAGVSYRDMLAEAGYLSALIVASLIVIEIGRVFAWPLAPADRAGRATDRRVRVLHALARPAAVHHHAADHDAARDDGARHRQLDHLTPRTRNGRHGAAARLGARVHLRADAGAAPVRGAARASLLAARPARAVLGDRGGRAVQPVGGDRRRGAAGGDALRCRQEFLLADLDRFRRRAVSEGRRGDDERPRRRWHAGASASSARCCSASIQDRAIGESLAAHDAHHGTQLHATFFTNEKSGVFGRYLALDEVKVAQGR